MSEKRDKEGSLWEEKRGGRGGEWRKRGTEVSKYFESLRASALGPAPAAWDFEGTGVARSQSKVGAVIMQREIYSFKEMIIKPPVHRKSQEKRRPISTPS